MTRIKRIDGTQWGRLYEVDGIKYPSVTTILNKWDKAGLLYWNGTTVGSYIKTEIKKCKPYEVEHVIDGIVETAIKRPNAVRDAAASRGIYYHEILEAHIKGYSYEAALHDDPLVEKMVRSIDKWVEKWEFEPMRDEGGKPLVETMVYSKEHHFAGTVDLIGTIEDEQRILVDFKTGNTIQKTAVAQIAAYAGAHAEMCGTWPDICCILHLLPSGNVKMKHVLDAQESVRAFAAFLNLYQYYKWDAEKK